MKTKALIIFVLTATIFVACSKKKDGGGNHPPQQNYYPQGGVYPNHNLINGQIRPNQFGLQTSQCYQTQSLGCRTTAPIFCNNFQDFRNGISPHVQYCNWLYEEGRHDCNPRAVRDAYMRNCMQLAATHNNFCVTGYSANFGFRTAGYYSSGYSYSGSTRGSSGDYPIYMKGNGTSGTTESTRPSQDVRPSAPATTTTTTTVVTSAPATVTQSSAQAPAQKDCVEEIVTENVDSISRLKIRVKSNEDFKDNLSISCLLDYSDNCQVTEPLNSSARIRPSVRISDRNNDSQLKRSFTNIIQASLDNKLSCKIDGSRKKVKYSDIQDACLISATSTTRRVVKCEEPTASQAPAAAATSVVVDQAPAAPTGATPGVFKDVKECGLNLEKIHNHLKSKDNSVVSFARKYIDSPEAKNLSAHDKLSVVDSAYKLPAGSNREEKKLNQNEFISAIGSLVTQSGDQLKINQDQGRITACEDNWLEAEFSSESGITYKARFASTPGSDENIGDILVTIHGDVYLPTKESSVRYVTVSLINWITKEKLSERDLKIVLGKHASRDESSMTSLKLSELNKELFEAKGYDVDRLIKNTGEIIRNTARKGSN